MAVVVVAMAMLLPDAAFSREPQPFRDFTFKRVKPPAPDTTRRITVQIEEQPEDQPPQEQKDAEVVSTKKPGEFDWFWTKLTSAPADIGHTEIVRLALAALSDPGAGVKAPRLETLTNIAERHGRDILAATVGTRISPAFALAVVAVESAGRPRAVSEKGATGLMQLMPATARRFGVSDSLLPAQNIRGGVAYLDWLIGHFDGDPILALAGYNAGEGAVRRHGGVPPYAETRAYIPKVLAAWSVARGLCLTPPELIGDGCVFVGPRTMARGG